MCVCVCVCVCVCPHLPVVKGKQTECLSLCVSPQISFKPKRVNSWNESLDEVEWGARYGGVLSHMTSGGEGEIKGLMVEYNNKNKGFHKRTTAERSGCGREQGIYWYMRKTGTCVQCLY